MKKRTAIILHNSVRYPILLITIPLQCVALLLKYLADLLKEVSNSWAKYLLKKYKLKNKINEKTEK